MEHKTLQLRRPRNNITDIYLVSNTLQFKYLTSIGPICWLLHYKKLLTKCAN